MSIWSPTTNIIRTGKYTYTKDRIFAIEPVADNPDNEPEVQTTSNKLYVQATYPIDPASALASLINNGIIVKKGNANLGTKTKPKNYDIYEFYRLLRDERLYDGNGNLVNEFDSAVNENDCLKFGECLTFASQSRDKELFEELLRGNSNPPLLKTQDDKRTKGKTFAETENDKDNIKLVKEVGLSKKNNYAIPQNGQSYAIVRKKIVLGSAAYHAAFVVYTHDGVNITLEAEADAGPTYQPKFSLYDINPEGNTFHRRWSAELYKKSADPEHKLRYDALYNNGETIVLQSRNMNDIMREIAQEKSKLVSVPVTVPLKKRSGGKKSKSKKHIRKIKQTRQIKTRTKKTKTNETNKNKN
jgi:hypothetical protein